MRWDTSRLSNCTDVNRLAQMNGESEASASGSPVTRMYSTRGN